MPGLLLVLRITLFFLALTGPLAAQTSWLLPSGYGDGLFQTANLRQFAADVRAASQGRLDIDIRPGGSHTPLARIRQRLESGEVAIGEFNLSAEAAVDPLFGLDALPFIVGSYADAELLWRLSRPAIEKAMARRGLIVLYAVPWPPQGIYANQLVNTPQDLRGLRLRSYNPATQRLAELLGATPVAVPLPELRAALAERRLDILLTSASSGVDAQAWDYLRFYFDVRAWYPKNVVAVNAAAFAALPEAERLALGEAARRAEARGWQASRQQDAADRKQLASRGLRVEEAPPRLVAGLERIGERLVGEYLKNAGPEALGILLTYNNQRSAPAR